MSSRVSAVASLLLRLPFELGAGLGTDAYGSVTKIEDATGIETGEVGAVYLSDYKVVL